MIGAGDWKATVKVESTLFLQEGDYRSPKDIPAPSNVASLGRYECNSIAKEVKSSPSSRQSNYQSISAIKESDAKMFIAAHQRQKDNIIFFSLVAVDSEDVEICIST